MKFDEAKLEQAFIELLENNIRKIGISDFSSTQWICRL